MLEKYSQALYITLIFERLYSNIYGSQISILKAVNSSSETKDSLKRFYDDAVNNYTAFFAGYPYDEYLKFLVHRELINETETVNGHESEKLIGITAFGRDFLKFMIETGKPFNKSF
jgi:hypothetical protein